MKPEGLGLPSFLETSCFERCETFGCTGGPGVQARSMSYPQLVTSGEQRATWLRCTMVGLHKVMRVC